MLSQKGKDRLLGTTVTACVALGGWLLHTVYSNAKEIVRLDERDKSTKEIVIEMRTEQKAYFHKVDERFERLQDKLEKINAK